MCILHGACESQSPRGSVAICQWSAVMGTDGVVGAGDGRGLGSKQPGRCLPGASRP